MFYCHCDQCTEPDDDPRCEVCGAVGEVDGDNHCESCAADIVGEDELHPRRPEGI